MDAPATTTADISCVWFACVFDWSAVMIDGLIAYPSRVLLLPMSCVRAELMVRSHLALWISNKKRTGLSLRTQTWPWCWCVWLAIAACFYHVSFACCFHECFGMLVELYQLPVCACVHLHGWQHGSVIYLRVHVSEPSTTVCFSCYVLF
jgi:hypothetical protein